jgi:hypothetical protein
MLNCAEGLKFKEYRRIILRLSVKQIFIGKLCVVVKWGSFYLRLDCKWQCVCM